MAPTPLKRTSLTIERKLEILRLAENGDSHTKIANDLKIPRTTISQIIGNKTKIISASASTNTKFKKARQCQFPKTDSALVQWFDVQRAASVPINGPILLQKAKEFAEKLGEITFRGSNGWLELWKKRHNISFQTVSGEAGAVNDEVIDNWLLNVWPIEREGYSDRDIFNADETGLFFKLLPNKTFERKGRTCTGGKLSKERVTLLLGSNADGSEKLKPLVVAKHENPRCFKNVKKASLPVHYYWNSSAWMTKLIFSDWLKKIDLQMRFKKRKIILLLDNCQPHKVDIKLNNIKLVFFPPNVTSKLQPMDQGIINETKKIYRSVVVKKIIECIDKQTVYQIDLLASILLLASAWKMIPATTLKNCFYHSKVTTRDPVIIEIEIEIEEEFDVAVTEEEMIRASLNAASFDEYVNVDDQVVTNELPTENQIIEGLNLTDSEVPDADSDGEDDPEIERPVITSIQAMSYLEDLKIWAMGREENPRVFNCIHTIETFVHKSRTNSLKQSSVTDYFVKI